jgi:hypothetical protein
MMENDAICEQCWHKETGMCDEIYKYICTPEDHEYFESKEEHHKHG